MNEDQNPYAYGYARMPRIIRKGYKHLTKMQKLLYIYIRDLCGEDGTCYRSLRSLQQETGFSIGYLSENIPILHNEDLIHAEMRKHQGSGWEIWHITIVDIWEKNATFLRTEKEKRSQDEQIETESVHGMNKSVHQMNSLEAKCSPDERSVHAMTLNKNNKELLITKNNDREDIAPVGDARADYPLITFADCLAYLGQQGVSPRGDAVEQMVQARTLYAYEHPRYEYHARPGVVEHPDDQLPSDAQSQQGDDNATLPPGTSDGSGALPGAGVGGDHDTAQDRPMATSATRPVLEAGEEIAVSKKGQADGHQHSATHHVADHLQPVLPSIPLSHQGRDYAQETLANTPTPESAQQNQSAGTPNGAVVGDVPLGNPPAQGAASPKGKGKKPAEPKPETPKSPPTEPPSDMAWGTRKCLMWFDYWRGGILISKFKLMQASTCAKGLAEQFSEEQVILARTDMEADPYYIAKGGCDVCDVANNIHKYLKRKQQTKKPAQSTNATQSQPITNIRELVRQREALRAATAVQVGV